MAVPKLVFQSVNQDRLSSLFHPPTHAPKMDVVQILQPFEVRDRHTSLYKQAGSPLNLTTLEAKKG
jgi:hypothetical protein